MKYLKSTTQKSYIFDNKVIPQCVTKDNLSLALTDEAFIKLQKDNKVIASLIKAGAIIVMDTEPQSPSKANAALTNRVAQLTLEKTKLEEELKQLRGSQGVNTEVEALKAQLAKQVEDDTAEIKQLQADKDAEIANLKAQLEAATSASKAAATAAAKVATTSEEA